MPSTVAVAGGTGGLGRALIEAILADGKFNVVIPARTVKHALLASFFSQLAGTKALWRRALRAQPAMQIRPRDRRIAKYIYTYS